MNIIMPVRFVRVNLKENKMVMSVGILIIVISCVIFGSLFWSIDYDIRKSKELKNSQLLRLARIAISDGSEQFICRSLEKIFKYFPEFITDSNCYKVGKLILWIEDQLEPWNTLESWLEHKHPESVLTTYYSEIDFKQKMKETRLAWLDNMIKICEEEENVH